MPVLYLGNKELLITVEVLNNINQFPESYDLYIEKKDMEKELYLQEMEDIFCDAQTEKIIRSNRLSVIMENMQKWYRSLPQYTRPSRSGVLKNCRSPATSILYCLTMNTEIR